MDGSYEVSWSIMKCLIEDAKHCAKQGDLETLNLALSGIEFHMKAIEAEFVQLCLIVENLRY